MLLEYRARFTGKLHALIANTRAATERSRISCLAFMKVAKLPSHCLNAAFRAGSSQENEKGKRQNGITNHHYPCGLEHFKLLP